VWEPVWDGGVRVCQTGGFGETGCGRDQDEDRAALRLELTLLHQPLALSLVVSSCDVLALTPPPCAPACTGGGAPGSSLMGVPGLLRPLLAFASCRRCPVCEGGPGPDPRTG